MIPRGGYPDESDSDSYVNRRPHDGQRPSGRRRQYHDRSGRPPDRGNDHNGGCSRRGRPPEDRVPPNDGEPLDDGGPPDDGEPPDDGGPLMMEDPLEMEIQNILEDKAHQAHQDLLDQ